VSQGLEESIHAVAGKTENCIYTPGDKALNDKIGDLLTHTNFLSVPML
jgi:hypothetical protein